MSTSLDGDGAGAGGAGLTRGEWLTTRGPRRRSRSAPSIESCRLAARPDGTYELTLSGRNLAFGAIPALIRVGDRPVRQVVAHGGTVLRGVVAGGEPGDEVTVDLGPGGLLSTTVDSV